MDTEQTSKLKRFCVGTVAETKVRGSAIIYVNPTEFMSFEKEDYKPNSISHSATYVDHRGVEKNANLKGDGILKAVWRNMGDSNRVTPPDVVKGETVQVYRFGDTDEYYWTDLGVKPGLRRLETVRYAFSNLPSGQTPYGDDTSYYVEISTHGKYFKLHLSDNDGELTTYDISINGKEGIFSVADGVGNDLTLDSGNGTLTGNIREAVVLNTKRYEVNASESYIVNTASSTIAAESHTTKASSITNDGPLECTDGMSVESKSGSSGVIKLKGNIDVEGNVTASGSVTGHINDLG